MLNPLQHFYGSTFIVRPPSPVTCNKAGANYKSETAHLEYAPRRAYDEWLAICDAIVACGGDAIFAFDESDERFLGHAELKVDAQGAVLGAGATLGSLAEIETGRVFAANGPWVIRDGGALRALMPTMLSHRRTEKIYYERLVEQLATACGLRCEIFSNPHAWEGLADVAVVGEQVVLTYAVAGHYDYAAPGKTLRSSRAGCEAAADFAKVPDSHRIFAELVYPHFHGDTVHFGARTANGPMLVHYPGGLWSGDSERVQQRLGGAFVPIAARDAVEEYAGNSRQVNSGVLVPDGVSEAFVASLNALGLTCARVPLLELFGKAGGGPACATLYLPDDLPVPKQHACRYSVQRTAAHERRERVPAVLRVDPAYFRGRARG